MISCAMDYPYYGACLVDIKLIQGKISLSCRVKSNPKNAINEHFLPRFLDFIVWGHEHECLVDPLVASLSLSLPKRRNTSGQSLRQCH